MSKLILYIHGKGGNAEEAKHYKALFKNSNVIGLDYTADSPWTAKDEFPILFDSICGNNQSVTVIANSIGAYYTMLSLNDRQIEKAFFISPIVNMEKLITNMMMWANVTEDKLREKGTIKTAFGETLSWSYLCYAREHPAKWNIPTHILYGEKDDLTSYETILEFAKEKNASLTVMKNGEHWFHTDRQMKYLDDWIKHFRSPLKTTG